MNPPRLVNDFVDLLSQQEQSALEQKLRNYHDTTSTQIYIVSLPDLDGDDIGDYAFKLGDKWGIGQKGKDNGILILIQPGNNNSSGSIFIATGYGLEGTIPDITANKIIETYLTPAFRQGQFYAGLDNATPVILKLLSGEFTADDIDGGMPVWSMLVIALLIVFVLLAISKGRKVGG